jgi:hypothetical protein
MFYTGGLLYVKATAVDAKKYFKHRLILLGSHYAADSGQA